MFFVCLFVLFCCCLLDFVDFYIVFKVHLEFKFM